MITSGSLASRYLRLRRVSNILLRKGNGGGGDSMIARRQKSGYGNEEEGRGEELLFASFIWRGVGRGASGSYTTAEEKRFDNPNRVKKTLCLFPNSFSLTSGRGRRRRRRCRRRRHLGIEVPSSSSSLVVLALLLPVLLLLPLPLSPGGRAAAAALGVGRPPTA